MGLVLVVVVLLAAANTMMMAAAERTREIGTLRALGTRPSAITRMFIAEGLILARRRLRRRGVGARWPSVRLSTTPG